MRPTSRLCQAVRITLFTRPNCGLCDSAKTVLASLGERRPFSYREVDIGKPDAQAWRDLYDFDVPVVRFPHLLSQLFRGVLLCAHGVSRWAVAYNLQIHVSRSSAPEEDPSVASRAAKLMHRFTEDEVEAKMTGVEGSG